jgi:bifunctional UDP-N-acetylglucosamine pyrophosphorylase/glucosamine-1-phosphate N-acetyltransferase
MIKNQIIIRAVELGRNKWLDIGLPWNLLEANSLAMQAIKEEIEGIVEKRANIKGPVIIKKDSIIRSGSYIEGPVIIDERADVGPNCFIRPYTYLGKDTRIGNACDIKNSIIMDGTHIAHLTYVGDSIVGERCNLGAGTITANRRFDKRNIKVNINGELLDSGTDKFGVIMGDDSQTGVNVTTYPGIKIGSDTWIAPNATVTRDVPNSSFLRSENIFKILNRK